MNRIPRKHRGDFDEFFLKEFASAVGNMIIMTFTFALSSLFISVVIYYL